MGMTTNQLALVRAIAENKMSDAKKYALCCCVEDNTQKNAPYVKRYKNLLENNSTMIEMPSNIKGMAQMEDVSISFREDRYYLSIREAELFKRISNMNEAGLKLMEMGIPYLNAVMLSGVSGTGKTTFGRYAAHKLELPFLYMNFSYLVDAYIGKTAQNLRNVFDFARMNKCLLMLDEIDCIALSRNGSSEGASREFNNTTITLMQELDKIQNDSIIIAATNIPDAIDPAVKRRFAIHHEVLPPTKEECISMMDKYLCSVGMIYSLTDIESATERIYTLNNQPTQALINNYVISKIADAIINKRERIMLV